MGRLPTIGPRRALLCATLLGVLVLAVFVGLRRPLAEPLPPVELARVRSAPARSRTPGVTLTVTAYEVHLDGSAVLADPRAEVAPLPRARTRLDLRAVVDGDSELLTQLELLHEVAGLDHDGKDHLDVPHVRLRVAADVRHADLLKVLHAIVRAGYHALEFEVATDDGVGHFNVRPYTFCGCLLPPTPSWCAVPELKIGPGGVTLVAVPDLTPPIGCHKALRAYGQPEVPFEAAVDWRDRVIAGPDGGCPSAQVGAGGLDVAALARRLAAVRRVAPGCAWTSVEVVRDVPWSVVAPALAAVYAEFGEVRTLFDVGDDASLSAGACARALPLAELTPAPTGPAPLLLGRRGCGE